MEHFTKSNGSLTQFIVNHFPNQTIQQGLYDYENGKVSRVETYDSSRVVGHVQAMEDYTVHIHLNKLDDSECTCSDGPLCKHIASVLLHLQDQQENGLITEDVIPPSIAEFAEIPERMESHLQSYFETTIIKRYKELTSSRYYTDEQVERYASRCLTTIASETALTKPRHELMALTVIIHGVSTLAVKLQTYEAFGRRFKRFFKTLLSEAESLIAKEFSLPDKGFDLWFLDTFFQRFLLMIDDPVNPWKPLFLTALLYEENDELKKKYYDYFIQHRQNSDHNDLLTLMTSTLALHCHQGAEALALLRKLSQPPTPNHLTYHFKLLKHRQEWETMRAWFELFSPRWKHKSLGELTNLYDEMLIKTGHKQKRLIEHWNQWLDNPSFRSYTEQMKHDNADKEKVLDYILPKLESQLYHPKIEPVYFKILKAENLSLRGLEYIHKYEKDPSSLSVEKQALLTDIKNNDPERIVPVYHQFVVRLIEKKSRTYYLQAVEYMRDLQLMYRQLGQEVRFQTYLKQLMQKYKTYRALLQEMKKIEY